MSSIKTALFGAALVTVIGIGGAIAADKDHGWSRWKGGEVEQSNKPTTYGPKCKSEFTSRGSGDVGYGITQYWAKRHTRRNWEEASVKLNGPDYGKWSKAKGTSVTCAQKDKQWQCKATGSPCA